MRNPDLAATYRQIGRGGVGAFYGGQIGAAIVDAVHHLPLAPGITLTQRPGSMTRADLSRYRAIVRAPTHVSYRGLDVFSMAPSSSGGTTVGEALNILSRFPLSQESRVQALHQYLEASRLAFADRNRYIGDPGYVKVPESTLLSPGFARRRACLITPSHALKSPVAPGSLTGSASCTPSRPANAKAPTDGSATNHFVIADRQGDVVSYTNTIEELGGNADRRARPRLSAQQRADRLRLRPAEHARPRSPTSRPPASGRARACRRPSSCATAARSWRWAPPGVPRSSPPCCRPSSSALDLHESLPAALAAPRAAQENQTATLAEPAFIHSATGAGLRKLGEKFETRHDVTAGPEDQDRPDDRRGLRSRGARPRAVRRLGRAHAGRRRGGGRPLSLRPPGRCGVRGGRERPRPRRRAAPQRGACPTHSSRPASSRRWPPSRRPGRRGARGPRPRSPSSA